MYSAYPGFNPRMVDCYGSPACIHCKLKHRLLDTIASGHKAKPIFKIGFTIEGQLLFDSICKVYVTNRIRHDEMVNCCVAVDCKNGIKPHRRPNLQPT